MHRPETTIKVIEEGRLESQETAQSQGNDQKRLEARVGIEPTHKGFADLSLTTWVPRPCSYVSVPAGKSPLAEQAGGKQKIWSGRRGSNPRHRPWQGRALPLSYSRSTGKLYRIFGQERPLAAARLVTRGRRYANSTSIFFAARSSFTMRKLRICPARAGSVLAGAPAPLFHRACSMELKEDRSAFDSFAASLFTGVTALVVTLQVALMPSPSSTRA